MTAGAGAVAVVSHSPPLPAPSASPSPPLCTLADEDDDAAAAAALSPLLLVDRLIEDAGGRRAFADLVRSEQYRRVRRVRFVDPSAAPAAACAAGQWTAARVASKQHLLDELLSAHPDDRQDTILCLRTYGYYYEDRSLYAPEQTRQHGVAHARLHARWWRRPLRSTLPTRHWHHCTYADVSQLVEQPETDGFEARFHRLYCRIYGLHEGQCVEPMPRDPRRGRWYRAEDGMPEDGRPLDDASLNDSNRLCSTQPNSINASLPPILSGSQLEQLYDDDSSSESDDEEDKAASFSSMDPSSQSSSSSSSSSASAAAAAAARRSLLPSRDPSHWCTVGVFVGSNVCPSVPLWVPLLANQHALQPLPLQVTERHMMSALAGGAAAARLFHVRVMQRVNVDQLDPLEEGDDGHSDDSHADDCGLSSGALLCSSPLAPTRARYGPVRFVCEDVARSYGVALTAAQWRAWHPSILQVQRTEEEEEAEAEEGEEAVWVACLSRAELQQHCSRVHAGSSATAPAHSLFGDSAHTVATFLQAVASDEAAAAAPLAHCVPSQPTDAARPSLSTLPNAAARMAAAALAATAAAAAGRDEPVPSLWPDDTCSSGMDESCWTFTPPPSPVAAPARPPRPPHSTRPPLQPAAAALEQQLEVEFVTLPSATLPAVTICHRTTAAAAAAPLAARPHDRPARQTRLRTPPRCCSCDDEEEQEEHSGRQSLTAKRLRMDSPPPPPPPPLPRQPRPAAAVDASSSSSSLPDHPPRVDSPLLELEWEDPEGELTQEEEEEEPLASEVDLDFEFD